MRKGVFPAGREINRDRLQTGEGWNGFTAGFLTGGLSGVAWAYILTQASSPQRENGCSCMAFWWLGMALPCVYFVVTCIPFKQHSTELTTSILVHCRHCHTTSRDTLLKAGSLCLRTYPQS